MYRYNCDKHVQTDCKNDHLTSKVLGHSDQTFNKPHFNLCSPSSVELAQVCPNYDLPVDQVMVLSAT